MIAFSKLLLVAALILTLYIGSCRGCFVLQLHGPGLSANLNVLLSSLPAFYGVNGSIYLDNRRFQYGCRDQGGFFDIFVPGMLQPYTNTKEQRGCAYYEFGNPVRKPVSDSEIAFCDGRYDPGILQQVWRLQPPFREEVDEALKVLKSYKGPTIAFHVRGGDKLNEDKATGRTTTFPVDLMNTYLDNFPGMKGGTCLLFGDEHRLLVDMERLAREHIGCRVAHGSRYYRAEGHHQQSFNMQPVEEKCRATKELITDLELMSNADYFVGSSTSGVPGIVATLRLVIYKKSQITLADATYNDMGAKLRRYWGLGGFKNITVDTVFSGVSSSRRMRDAECHSHDC